MRYATVLLLIAVLLGGCSSGPESMIGESKQEVLAEVDVADISTDRSMEFGAASQDMYADFGEFISEKSALGGKLTPSFDDMSDDVKARMQVGFTTVMERTAEARAGHGHSTATIWYFWDEDDRLIATLREDWQ